MMPIPVVEFAEQRSIENTDLGVGSATSADGYTAMTVSVSATLWRNPEDKSDPVNLAELDDDTRRAIEEVPPWPRPAWLIELVERMRFPHLWEAVRTSWHRDESDLSTLEYLLVHHTRHVLVNQFRTELALEMHDWDSPLLPSESAVRHGAFVSIDGQDVVGAEIDSDHFVYALGAKLSSGGTLTAVVPREHLRYINLSFASRC